MGWDLAVAFAALAVAIGVGLGLKVRRLQHDLARSRRRRASHPATPGPADGGATGPATDAAPAPPPIAAPPAAPPPVVPAPDTDRRLDALWALTLLEQRGHHDLARRSAGLDDPARRSAGLDDPARPSAGREGTSAGPTDLGSALAVEVERIREEVGTPGSLDTRMAGPLGDVDAVVAFHAARQLLGVLVPHTQAFDLSVAASEHEVVVELTCTGWEGGPEVADRMAELLEAVSIGGADLQLDTPAGVDGVRTRLRLPRR